MDHPEGAHETGERQPDFTREEYRTLIRKLPSWIDAGKSGKPTDMRQLMRDYVLILANTGMRHGTEALNLMWKHVALFEDGGQQYLEMSVTYNNDRPNMGIGGITPAMKLKMAA